MDKEKNNSISSQLAKNIINSINEDNRNAETNYNSLNISALIETTIQECLSNSREYAQKIIDAKKNDLKNNYPQSQQNLNYQFWINDIFKSFRNDKSVYRKAVNFAKDKSEIKEERLKLIIDFIENHLNNNIYGFVNKLQFLEDFKGNVQESMLYEVLVNHFKEIEKPLKAQQESENDTQKEDPYLISYSSDNAIEFRNQKTVFPFPVSDLFRLITSLRETILKEDVCAVDLQEYPDKIFKETDLKDYPDLSAYIYNIIEVWVTEIEISLHNGNKKRLFDSFLKLCEEKAITNISNETREPINKDVFNYLSALSKEEIEEKIQNAETLKRLCEISIDYSKGGIWSVGKLPIEFDAITKVDLFVENFIKSIEILAKDGKDVQQLIDLFIQTVKTNLENPLLEKNAKINRHLFNRLEGVKLLLQNVKALPPQQKKEAESQINTLKNEIETAFSFMQHNDPRKHRRIISDDDFDSLMKWITYYFENNFTIPEIDKPIKFINTNKGNVVYTFIKIFKDLHPTKTRPDSLFELIKLCFYDYRNDNISNYKKQKKPQFYSQLINKK